MSSPIHQAVTQNRPRIFFVQLQTILLALTIVLLPTNLFFSVEKESAYAHGILVDYLLPKLYLSDIPVVLLLIFWGVFAAKNKTTKHKKKKRLMIFLSFFVFAILHLFLNRASPFPLATIWFLIKLLEMGLFSFWLISHAKLLQQRTALFAFAGMLIFQSVLAFYQYFAQHSLFGYLFFGEPNLMLSSFIAKTKYFGGLQILPYGTTPHPNILAGIIAFGILLFLTVYRHWTYSKFVVSITFIALVLTQSAYTWVALSIGLLLLISKKSMRFSAMVSILLAIPVLLYLLSNTLHVRTTSVTRRVQLQEIALQAFRSNPMFGIGLNQFSARSEEFGTVPAGIRFLQPVHSVPLLFLSETGVSGLIFIFLFIYVVHNMYSSKKEFLSAFLIMIIIVISLDHYIFTIQQGQLLFAFLLGFLLTKRKKVMLE